MWCCDAVRTQRGRRHQPHIFTSARFIWNIYPLQKVTDGKVAAKLKSDERSARIFFAAEFNCSVHCKITIVSTDTIRNAHSLGKWDNTTADIILWTLYIRTFIAKSLMSSKQDSFFATTGCWRQEGKSGRSGRFCLVWFGLNQTLSGRGVSPIRKISLEKAPHSFLKRGQGGGHRGRLKFEVFQKIIPWYGSVPKSVSYREGRYRACADRNGGIGRYF